MGDYTPPVRGLFEVGQCVPVGEMGLNESARAP